MHVFCRLDCFNGRLDLRHRSEELFSGWLARSMADSTHRERTRHNQNNLAYPKVPTSLGHLVGRGLDYVRYTEIRMRDSNGRITKVHDLAGRHLSDVFSWINVHYILNHSQLNCISPQEPIIDSSLVYASLHAIRRVVRKNGTGSAAEIR